MEIFWYIASAVLAGVGTGLAGLSAATVMVPILLVLCPSFFGETGAYTATAIALASDIFGSALTAAIYIRHKNIDLRRGMIMLVCIVSMCIAGSFAAWKVGNVVLGTFSLFLTFFIGIRFLLKPDTQRKQTAAAGSRLGAKEIAVSIFFGLTIGFGTGFFGSGGGMMMLVVFTAFLGMEQKRAVGTSTLIMTFTALIASVSHIAIHPAILLERWDVLVICMVTATLASIVSAQFANRFPTRTVGLVTGWVLTLLGGCMLILHYREKLTSSALLMDTLSCFWGFVRFIVLAVCLLLLIRFLFKPDREVFRKILHTAAYCCSAAFVGFTENWLPASLASALVAAIVYPLLALGERLSCYSAFFNQRRPGEVKRSMLLLFLTFSVLNAFGWGVMHSRWLSVCAILMWGPGDAAAALVGRRFGRHKITLPLADRKKSWEGSLAMTAVSFLCGAVCLTLCGVFPLGKALFAALMTAPAAACVELITKNGDDTVTVPTVNMLVLSLLTILL